MVFWQYILKTFHIRKNDTSIARKDYTKNKLKYQSLLKVNKAIILIII